MSIKFKTIYKNGVSKITHFLDTTSDDGDLPRFVTNKWIEFYDQSEEIYDSNKKTTKLKHLS